ncbi:Fatty acyl-CoA elongase/Polyunsaturated fatty acid specific elongation enzyme, partial [Spiromyces aspiralis]
QIIPIIHKHGFVWAICDEFSWTQPLELLYYINYIFKWVEFIDTLFLVLKKKKLEFLHVYHHSLTMVLCYSQLLGRTSVSWPICTINLFVHVVMYYYYYLASIGTKVWWKKHVTTLQITQFIVDLFLVVFSQYTNMAYHNYPHWPNMGNCRGSRTAAFIGSFLLSSYLILFVQFFAKTYKQSRPSTAAASVKFKKQ